MPHRCRGASLKLCLVGDFYLVLRLAKLSELLTVVKSKSFDDRLSRFLLGYTGYDTDQQAPRTEQCQYS
jgi:hypothetical protein